MKISKVGIDLIKERESCELTAYRDSVGIWTVGYGSTGPDIGEDTEWTQAQADNWLEEFLEHMCEGINRHVKVELTQSQYDALCSLVYNIGLGAFERSSLLSLINSSSFLAAANEFLKWCKAGGVELPGLLSRRHIERALFLSGTP